MSNPSNAGIAPWLRSAADAAPRLGIELVVVDVVARQDFEPAFARIEQSQAEALGLGEPLTLINREAVIAFATRRRLPALYTLEDFVRDAGLMSYSTSFRMQFRRADYVDKILKGANPAELPVEAGRVRDAGELENRPRARSGICRAFLRSPTR